MIAQTKKGAIKFSPSIYGKWNRPIIYYKDSKKFKLGCFIDTKTETLKAVEKKYGKESDYYKAILNFETLEYKSKDYTKIDLGKNYLTSLDVSNNTELTYLDVQNNDLTSIDVSNNTKLEILDLYNNNLTSIDVSNNTKLIGVFLIDNNLTNLDLSKNIELERLYVCNNNLTSIDVSNNIKLEVLDVENNDLTSLDVSNNTKLEVLDVQNNPNLKEVIIKKGQKIYIEKDKHTKIIYID